MTDRLLTREEVATLLGVTTASLRNMAYRGTGPTCIRLGHRTVRYRQVDVDRWIERHVVRQ